MHVDPLVQLYLERERDRRLRADLERMARELRDKTRALRPVMERAREARGAAQRMDGPSGFVMVPSKR